MKEKDLLQEHPFSDVAELNISETMVYINVIVDAQELISRYNSPSHKPELPTPILPQDVTDCICMVATRSNAISGHGKGDLTVQIFNYDSLWWSATSETQNSDCTVTPYGVTHRSGKTIIKKPKYQSLSIKVFVPTEDDPTKGSFEKCTFPSITADTMPFKKKATENYLFKFSLYARDRKTGPYLYGYFRIDPTIVIN